MGIALGALDIPQGNLPNQPRATPEPALRAGQLAADSSNAAGCV